MRFIKKLALYAKNPVDDRFSVSADNRIVTNSTVSLQVPVGAKANRPATPVLSDGMIRYNTDLKEFEVYNSYNPGPYPWEILRTVRPAKIKVQTLGYGNGVDYIFGPLDPEYKVTRPENIMVFYGPAFQIATTNYTLTNTAPAATTTLSASTSSGATTLYLNTLTNIDIGEAGKWRTLTPISGIQSNTTVTNVIGVYNPTFGGWAVRISLPTTGILSSGTTITVNYPAGTFVQFTGGLPAGVDIPVVALLGFDGYFGAGPDGTAFES